MITIRSNEQLGLTRALSRAATSYTREIKGEMFLYQYWLPTTLEMQFSSCDAMPPIPVLYERQTMIASVMLVILFLAGCVSTASAWSSGSGTCFADEHSIVTKAVRHPLATTMGFYVDVPQHYVAGESYNITFQNTGALGINMFNGFLLYATDATATRVGTFTAMPLAPKPTTTNMASAVESVEMIDGTFACESAPAATITHASGAPKLVGFSVVWTAPPTDIGNVTFVGVVTWSSTTYWSQVLMPAAVCSPSSSGCTGNVSSLLPTGPLPTLPPNSYVPSVAAANATLCGHFGTIENTYMQPSWCASYWVRTGLDNPRSMYVTANGAVLLIESNKVSVLRDLNADGTINVTSAEKVQIAYYSGLNHAIWLDEQLQWLYVSTTNILIRYAFDPNNMTALLTGTERTVVKNLPGGGHWSRTMIVDSVGRLYVQSGSAWNIDRTSVRSRIKRWSAQNVSNIPAGGWDWSTSGEIFADGLRNEVGFNFDLTGDLWGVMNSGDNLNRADLGGPAARASNPAEPLHHFSENKLGRYWGYPACFANYNFPQFAPKTQLFWNDSTNPVIDNYHGLNTTDAYCQNASYVEPIAYAMPGHYAPLGLVFYDATKTGPFSFPRSWHNQLFVTSHGSHNAIPQVGRQLLRIDMDERNEPSSHHEFFGSFAGADWSYRPVEVRQLNTGELIVSAGNTGESAGAIFIIRYMGAPPPQLISSSSSASPLSSSSSLSFSSLPSSTTSSSALSASSTSATSSALSPSSASSIASSTLSVSSSSSSPSAIPKSNDGTFMESTAGLLIIAVIVFVVLVVAFLAFYMVCTRRASHLGLEEQLMAQEMSYSSATDDTAAKY